MKLCQVIICSNFVISTLIWPQNIILSIFILTYLYLPLFTYIWLYLGLIILIWAYLPFNGLILPYVPYSPYICILLLRLHLCEFFFRAIGLLFMAINCISKIWGIQVLSANAVWVLIWSVTILYVVSDTSNSV